MSQGQSLLLKDRRRKVPVALSSRTTRARYMFFDFVLGRSFGLRGSGCSVLEAQPFSLGATCQSLDAQSRELFEDLLEKAQEITSLAL